MTDYIGKKVLYMTEYGESIETVASIDEDGRVYFVPNKFGTVNTAMLASLIANNQIFPDPADYGTEWEQTADELRGAMGIISQTEEALGTRMTISGGVSSPAWWDAIEEVKF